MEVPPESIVYDEIEMALKDSPISSTWDGVKQLEPTDPRSFSWRRYQERISGADAEKWSTPNADNELNLHEVGSECIIWQELTKEMLQTFNKLFPHLVVSDLNDENCATFTVDEVMSSYIHSLDNDALFKNSVLIDVICDPIVKRLSEKIGDVGICCASDSLRSKSMTAPLNYLCGKRTDQSGITDWVMRRYGGNRREASLYVNLMWWVGYFMCVTCGNFSKKMVVDSSMSFIAAGVMESNTSSDGDRITPMIDKTVLANAAKKSADKSISPAIRRCTGIEAIIACRRGYAKKYKDVYQKVSSTVDTKDITPAAYLKSRYMDAMSFSFAGTIYSSDFGKTFNWMAGSIYQPSFDTGMHYNDLCDALMDLKYIESHNYVICAKSNSNYSFSDHSEALYVALTTFDDPFGRYDNKIKRRMCRYRLTNFIYQALWPRYRACERARRFVANLNKEERNNLIERGRRCIQGDIFIEENMWLDAMCSNYNKRRAEIRDRGYIDTLLYILRVQYDQSARDHIQSAVQAIGMRPFDTALEMLTSLGSEWLAQLALRSVMESSSYEDLIADFSDLLTTFSHSSMPIISDDTITPCESICGPLFFRLMEMLSVVSEINNIAGEAMMSTVASLLAMVSLDPFRCIAYQADMLLMSN